MDSATFVIIGAHGQLGTALRKQYPDATALDSDTLDITDAHAVESYDWSGVTHIFNAAAYTNVDGAETVDGRKSAWTVNALGVSNLAKISMQNDITLFHVSTEYVFDGTQTIHTETESFSPLSVYSSTKAAADLIVSIVPKNYILRVSWLIGEGKNFVATMASIAERNISPSVVNDQIGRLTFTSELVKAIDHLLVNSCEYGTYNLSNSGESKSWADITRVIFSLLEKNELTVTDVSTEEYFKDKPGTAPRPLQSTLDLAKIHATGFVSTDWEQYLSTYLKEYTS